MRARRPYLRARNAALRRLRAGGVETRPLLLVPLRESDSQELAPVVVLERAFQLHVDQTSGLLVVGQLRLVGRDAHDPNQGVVEGVGQPARRHVPGEVEPQSVRHRFS